VREEVGDVTILVNNAGAVYIKKLLNQSADEIVRIININLISHYWASDIFEIHMRSSYEINIYIK